MSPKPKPDAPPPDPQLSFLERLRAPAATAPATTPSPSPATQEPPEAAATPAKPATPESAATATTTTTEPATPAGAAPATATPAPAPAPVAPPAPRIYVVSELLRAVRLTLESRFADVRVDGEISGLKRSGNGHVYFCLKDAEAQLDCVLFSREAARLKFRLEEGLAVRCRGRLTLYEARGKFQMTVAEVEPTGAGALALAFEQRKAKLAAEGLFDQARKRPLPFLPRRLGVVTSSSGAVIRDIVRVAHRRFPVPILLAATPVQGDGAALAIASAIRRLQEVADVDVIIVARGGGSLEDLWAFNEEPVARAIFGCRVPVISAVGHETDFTIADFVADVRAPTPSAAAERAVPVMDDLRAELALLCRRGGRASLGEVRAARHVLERAGARLGDPRRMLDERRQRLDDQIDRARRHLHRQVAAARGELRALEVRLGRAHPHRRIVERRGELGRLGHRLESAVKRQLALRRSVVEGAKGKLGALSPLAVLERGFSLALRPDGHVLTRADEVAPGDRIRVRLREGELAAKVEKKEDELIRAAVLGADVSKSRSPAIHLAAFEALGVDGSYEAFSVDAAAFDARVAALRAAGYRYLNVTIPHKLAAARLADVQGPEVRVSHAANTLIFAADGVRAENTDGVGLIAALADMGFAPAGHVVVMVGAGGAAAGAVEALTRAGADVRLVARRREAADELRERLPEPQRQRLTTAAWDDGLAGAIAGAGALVSAVPAAAWSGADAQAGLRALHASTVVLEMAYGGVTPLATAVKPHGAPYADGLGMLAHQAARAIELALGTTPPVAPLLRAARTG